MLRISSVFICTMADPLGSAPSRGKQPSPRYGEWDRQDSNLHADSQKVIPGFLPDYLATVLHVVLRLPFRHGPLSGTSSYDVGFFYPLDQPPPVVNTFILSISGTSGEFNPASQILPR